MPRYFAWYQTSTAMAASYTYSAAQLAANDQLQARAWGWDSSPVHRHYKSVLKNGQIKYVYTVSYTRTPSAAAAADVKRHWAQAIELKSALSRPQQSVKAALTSMSGAFNAARIAESNPITLETRLHTAIQAATSACSELSRKRSEVSKHYEATHNAHQHVVVMTPLIFGMGIPAHSDVKTALEQHMRDHTDERSQAHSLEPALAAQAQVVTAVKAWQAAIRDRWTAQRAYMPVETWWDRISVKMEAKPRLTPAIPVNRATVATQILRADEVGPEDEKWKQAEAEVASKEAALLEAIHARDAAMAEVAQVFGVKLLI